MRAAYMGGHQINQWSLMVGEYSTRKRLATLGFVSDFSQMLAWEVEVFTLIDAEVNKLQDAELKKKHGKR